MTDWIRLTPKYWTRCSKRHGGCGGEISPYQETWALPSDGKRVRFYWLCSKCAKKRALVTPVRQCHEPLTFNRPAWWDK